MNNAEAYMKLGSIIGAPSSTTVGGKAVPAILQGHTSLGDALQVVLTVFKFALEVIKIILLLFGLIMRLFLVFVSAGIP